LSLGWATDQENPNLEAAPSLDSTDGSDTPLHLDAALSVLKYVNDPTPQTDDIITYMVTVSNGGPAIARNVEVIDKLLAGLYYQSHSATQGTYDNISGLWTVGNLADGDSATLTITAQVNATGPITITNTATIGTLSQPDPDTGDNSDSADIYIGESPPDEADLIVLKYVDNHIPYEGDTITFTVIVENTGPVEATNIQITDQLPGSVTYKSHSTATGTYTSSTGVWAIPSLANGTYAVLTITATVNSGTAGSTIPNIAMVTSLSQTDPDLGDNYAEAEYFPQEVPVYPTGPSQSARSVPALVTIIAMVVVLVDKVLSVFVTVTPGVVNGCGIGAIQANITCIGNNLIGDLSNTINAVAALVPNLLVGLGVH